MGFNSVIFEKKLDMNLDIGLKFDNVQILKKIEKYINRRGGKMILLEMPSTLDVKNKNFFEKVVGKICTDAVYRSLGNPILEGELFFTKYRKKYFFNMVMKYPELYKNCFDINKVDYIKSVSRDNPDIIQSDAFFIFEDYKSDSINIESGIRIENEKNDKPHNIFLFGASNAFGYYVSDKETITSYLREYCLNDYNVFNCATNGETMINLYNRIINFDIEKNDIVIVGCTPLMLKDKMNLFSTIKTIDYFEKSHEKENFVDIAHYTSFCHRKLAEIIFNGIKDLINQDPRYFLEESKIKIVDNIIKNYNNEINKAGWKISNDDNVGIAVLSANPFTIGHRHLAELGAKMFDYFVLFLMQDGCDLIFNKKDCENIVKVGVDDLSNVIVVPFPDNIISFDDFCPAYNSVAVRHAKNFVGINIYDLGNILVYLCKRAKFKHYIAGIETNDAVTRQMTLHFKYVCEMNDINFVFIPRKKMKKGIKSISGSECRELIKRNEYEQLVDVLQPCVLKYIIDNALQTCENKKPDKTSKILNIYEKGLKNNLAKDLCMIDIDEKDYLIVINEIMMYVKAMDLLNKNFIKESLEMLKRLYDTGTKMKYWAGYQYIMNTDVYSDEMVHDSLEGILDKKCIDRMQQKINKDIELSVKK